MQHETRYAFRITESISSLRKSEGNCSSVVEDDNAFALMYAAERGTRGQVLIKKGRKPVDQYKDQKRAQERREAEAAAETVLRHRIADNERRHPEIFAKVRSPDFIDWYLAATGSAWDRRFESDIDEMRFRIVSASVASQKNLEIAVKKD